ncbi:MAG: DUF6114 domain-containing protein [Candidatus Hadarchaeales archaeon]
MEISQEVAPPVEVPPTPEPSGGRHFRLPSLPHLKGLGEKWNSVAITIGMGFLNFWNKKHFVFPILLGCCALTVWYHSFTHSLLSFTLSVTFLLTTLLLAFIGLVVMDYIQKDLASTGRVVTQTLAGISLLLGFLFYLDLSIGGFLPAPPLLILLSIMWAVPILPYAVLAIFLPLLVGRLPWFRSRWESLRERYPFWAIYCAVLGGLIILYVPLRFFPMYMYSSLVFWGMFLGSSCLAMAAIMAMFPRRESCKIVGLFLVIMAALSWMGTLGGALLGSLFCIAAGAHAYAWRPASGS